METEAEFRLFPAVSSSLRGGRPTHHKACAGHDTGFMSFDDAAVDSQAPAEVIRVDY